MIRDTQRHGPQNSSVFLFAQFTIISVQHKVLDLHARIQKNFSGGGGGGSKFPEGV